MPTIDRWKGYRFYFFSQDRIEPPHLHIDKDGNTLKIWLSGLKIAYNDRYNLHEITQIVDHVEENRQRFLKAWHDYFDR